MVSHAKLVLMAVAVLVIGFGVVDSQARRKHSHAVTLKHYLRSASLPAGGVGAVDVSCPRGYKATGGGYESSELATVPVYRQFVDGYRVIAANETSTAGTITAYVACLKGRTSATRASARRPLRAEIRQYQEQLDKR